MSCFSRVFLYNYEIMTKKKKKKMPDFKAFGRQIVTALFLMVFLVLLYSLVAGDMESPKELTLSELAVEINGGNVSKIIVKGDELEVSLKEGGERVSKKESETALSQSLVNYGVAQENIAGVNIEIKNPTGLGFWLINILPFLLPLIFVLIFFWFIARQARSNALQAFSFGQSKAKVTGPEDKKERVTFKDVAGVEEAKEELKEIVDFLKSPQKFLDIGARIPKGVLLMGAPGTGKTLLARAVSGEAGVPFFHISGSEFVEMFVGVGASRVRDLFKVAKKSSPAIVFVDEIDAVGRHRGTGLGGGHDEREQTLNQILVELDGFEPHEKVIVMAATNRPDVLDPALLRPGRFDRRVILDLPDIKDREAILKIHARKKPLTDGVDLKRIAERTPGFSGADLQNLMNEGAILVAREGRKEITQDDLTRSIEKVMLGPERKSHILTQKEKKISSYHEAGHALVTATLPNADPIHKVSVVARGRAAGYTLKLPIEEKHLYSRSHFLDELTVALGGYASERIIFKDVTTGASDDIKNATDIARSLVTKYGMSERIGPVALGEESGMVFLGKELGADRNYSEDVAKAVDEEVSILMKDALVRADELLKKHRPALDAIAEKLIKDESIERDEFESLMENFGIKKK